MNNNHTTSLDGPDILCDSDVTITESSKEDYNAGITVSMPTNTSINNPNCNFIYLKNNDGIALHCDLLGPDKKIYDNELQVTRAVELEYLGSVTAELLLKNLFKDIGIVIYILIISSKVE
jgi:hypothetical protein